MEEGTNNDNEFPKLNIEQENEFKKIKLNLEHGAIFPDNMSENLTPEVEALFLDSVINFENDYRNVKRISIYEKIGKPEFKVAACLSDEDIVFELEQLEKILHQHGLNLEVLASSVKETRLIYTFVTENLFWKKIADIEAPGMLTNYNYEEFHPNHKHDLEKATEDFLRMFLDTKSNFYDEYHAQDASNHEELNSFRSIFKKFKMKFFNIYKVTFDQQHAKVEFNIDFWAKIKGTKTIMNYEGEGSFTFEKENRYWSVRKVSLPIKD